MSRFTTATALTARSEQAQFLCAAHSVTPAVGAELAVDHPLMAFHGVDRQVELGGDLGVGQGAREVAQDVLFAVG